jgi:curli production assembly/transport component CsgG
MIAAQAMPMAELTTQALSFKAAWGSLLVLSLLLGGCGTVAPIPQQHQPSNVNEDAVLTPTTRITRDLVRLPPPKFRVPVAVYAFRDQTGQFKPQPDSNLSNAVTQGAASILVKALLDSGWYLPIEREGFQNLLTERRVAKALESPTDKGKPGSSYPPLMAANFLIEGGVIGYETNVRTGGGGAALLGIGGETKYRVDQVTVNLRSVDVRSGQIINSVSVTKTIFSREVSANVYKFVSYKTLLQAEGGFSTNEPTQLAVKEAIESAVIHLTVQGMRDGAWALKDEKDWGSSLIQAYLRDQGSNLAEEAARPVAEVAEQVSMGPSTMVLPPIPPLPITPVARTAAPAAPVVSTAPVASPPALPAAVASPALSPVPSPAAGRAAGASAATASALPTPSAPPEPPEPPSKAVQTMPLIREAVPAKDEDVRADATLPARSVSRPLVAPLLAPTASTLPEDSPADLTVVLATP